MEANAASRFSPAMSDFSEEEFVEVKKGPWTAEEDALLLNYVNVHGEGRWNSVACCAGLKRTGKSCRLRWLNYLRPDLRRGNITLQEQLLILELHSRWGNRWSKIAQYLPGRTDNEIKNYWRTRVQKQAKQLKCDVNSKQFRDAMQHVWIPRLKERIQSSLSNNLSSTQATDTAIHAADPRGNPAGNQVVYQMDHSGSTSFSPSFSCEVPAASTGSYSDSNRSSLASYPSERYGQQQDRSCMESFTEGPWSSPWPESSLEYEESNYYWLGDQEELMMENLWNQENIEFLQQQLFDD